MRLRDSNKTKAYSRWQYFITVILMISMLSESAFFAFYALIGRVYGGSDTSGIYRIYLVLLLLFNLMLWGFKKASTGKMKAMELILLCIPIIYVILIGVTSLRYGGLAGEMKSGVIYLFMWQYMAIFTVLNLQCYSNLNIAVDVLDWYIILVFLGGCRAATQRGAVLSVIGSFGGATYQAASYFFSFAFGINTFLLLQQKKMSFLRKLSIKTNNIIRLFISAVLVCLVLFSGGRAGIVVVVAYLLVLTVWVWRNRKFSFNIWVLGALTSFALVFFVLTVLIDHPAFAASFERIFSYITNQGIDLSKTSGRDIIYAAYGQWIKRKPIFGYGIFSHYFLEEHAPHNIILEMITEGGIVYFIVWILVFMVIYQKWHHRKSESKYFMIIMGIYPLVKLLFSGSYLNDELFWVFVAWGLLSNVEWRNKND